MHRRAFAATAAMTCAAILLADPAASHVRAGDDDRPRPVAGSGLFGLNRVVGLHLEIPLEEYQAMQPPPPAGFGGPPQPLVPRRPGARESERNLFGLEFPWAHGALTAEGRTYRPVGVRYSGNASYMASAGD
jgi:hypothetical protein